MLEKLADYDDELMEQLLEDVPPPRDKVFDDLSKELRDGLICPVLLGSAETSHGIFRLLKALRHEVPFVEATAKRLGVDKKPSAAFVAKTFHTAHGGKLSLARVLTGSFADGATVYGGADEERISGLFTLHGPGADQARRGGRRRHGRVRPPRQHQDRRHAGRGKGQQGQDRNAPPSAKPVFGLAIAAKEKKDEVKLTAAIAKIIEEDPSISLTHSQDMGEMVLWGQGEMHLRVALEKLVRKYGIDASTRPRQIPYKETIRKSVGGARPPQEAIGRARPVRRRGGDDQAAAARRRVRVLRRDHRRRRAEELHPARSRSACATIWHIGPLGFPGGRCRGLPDRRLLSHRSIRSDMAFRQAGRIAMSEGMPQCSPVLLEPVMAVEIAVPSDATAKINSIVSSRRGQILGFDARPGWPGWDLVEVHLPESEIQNLIVELRSATAGVGTFNAKFDHLAELTGKVADQVLAGKREKAA